MRRAFPSDALADHLKHHGLRSGLFRHSAFVAKRIGERGRNMLGKKHKDATSGAVLLVLTADPGARAQRLPVFGRALA